MTIKKWIDINIPSFNNKIVLITGSTSGIGLDAAKIIASKKGKIILASRSMEKLKKAKNDIESMYPNSVLSIIPLDLSSKESISNAINSLKSENKKIDILINNAGCYMNQSKTTVDGYEYTLGTNFLGTFLFTEGLLDFCNKIVFTSSITARHAKLYLKEYDEISHLNRNKLYGSSKLAICCYAYYLMNSTQKSIVLAHPGIAGTDILNSNKTDFNSVFSSIGKFWMKHFCNSSIEGSLPLVLAASETGQDNAYYGPKYLFQIKGKPKKVKIPRNVIRNYKSIYENTKNFIALHDKKRP